MKMTYENPVMSPVVSIDFLVSEISLMPVHLIVNLEELLGNWIQKNCYAIEINVNMFL